MCTCVGTDTVFSALAGEGPTVLAGGAGDGAAGGDGGSSGKQRETGCQSRGRAGGGSEQTDGEAMATTNNDHASMVPGG